MLIVMDALSLLLNAGCGNNDKSSASNGSSTTGVKDETKQAESTEKKEPVTINFVTGGDLSSAGIEDMVKLYEQKSGNKVDMTVLPKGNEYTTVLRTRWATKDYPDAVYYFATNAHYDWLKANEVLIDLTNEPCAQNMTDVVKKSFTWTDNKVYGTALGGTNFIGVLYNKAAFQKAGVSGTPKNYADFLSICEKLKTAGITPIYEAAKDAWPVQVFTLSAWSTFVDPVIGAEGIEKINTNKLKVTDIPQVTDMFKRQVELKTKGYLNNDLMSASVDKQYEMIATGKCGMVFQVGFILGSINEKYPDNMKDLGFFPIPSDTDEGIAGVYLPNQIFGVKVNENADTTKEFINFMASPEAQDIWYKANPAISAYKNVTVEGMFPPSVDFVKYVDAGKAEAMCQMTIKPTFLNYDKITQSLILGLYTPEQAVQKMAEEILNDGKNRELPGFVN